MKIQVPNRKPTRRHQQRGFALIVTLSLMILLTVIAVGLLSLSAITLRASGQGSAMSTARANARMALMLAIGELQKSAGPDQRITARADVLGADSASPRLTGVWKSWDIKASSPPSANDYEKAERDKKFLGWLASASDPVSMANVDFAKSAPVTPVTLWGKGTLGDNPVQADVVTANKVTISKTKGAYAWAVMDEGVKARINTPYVEAASTKGMQTAQLGAGVRPKTSTIPGLSKLERGFFEKTSVNFATIEKGISKLNLELATETLAAGTRDLLKPLVHDVTASSVGLFTDTAVGGLKEDFSLLTNKSLPSVYNGAGIYASRLGLTGMVSDPRWESLRQFSQIYQDKTRLTLTGGVPVLKAQGPANWRASLNSDPTSGVQGVAQRTPPSGVVLMPEIVKVQVVFSLLTRDIYNYPKVSDTTPKIAGTKTEETTAELHSPWGGNFAGSGYDYLLHLLYTPVVTVHNPYNVAIDFNELRVVFGNVPFAIQVFRNGQAQTNAPAPLDTMYYKDSELGKIPKRFGMTLKTNGGTPTAPVVGVTSFRLLPGEVMMFSPYIPPTRTWKDEYSNRMFSDWDTGQGTATRTLTIDGLPGWRGDGIGFDLDWFCPLYKNLRITDKEVDNGTSMNRGGCIAAKATDQFSVQFAPLSVDGLSNNKFTVEMFAKPPTSPSTFVSSGVIEMDYETPTGLQDALLGKNGTITYPNPKNTKKTVGAMEMHSHSLTAIKDIGTAKAFAVVSAQAKTTMGGLNQDGEDGKLATKPYCFAHATAGVSSGKFLSENPANQSHEFAIQRLDNGTTNLLQYDPKTGRGNHITGLTGNTGVKFGSQYDIPLAPIQTLTGLNGANPGGSSGYLPRFAQPIGNSWAHPMLDSSKVVTAGGSYPYLDHSFLLNLALYDHFFFSGFADQGGALISPTKSAASLADDLVAGKPLPDPRVALYNPPGKDPATLTTDVADPIAYSKIASRLMMNGAFNINSTSVAAWKAMLGSIHDSQALVNKINRIGKTSALTTISATNDKKNEARISRFRLPASESTKDSSLSLADSKEAYWLGAREYTEAQMQTLAEKIVDQVRLRGPFLSMSEFVNRRLGTGPTAQRGALQQAIDDANLNADIANSNLAGFPITSAMVGGYKYKNAEAGTGSSYQGAPGYLTQADLLGVLGNAATPRSDTFTIRGYGEARDSSGKVTASAICEAVVQRIPEYIDSTDKPEIAVNALAQNVNKVFGRRFQIVTFRWLAQNEV